MRRWLYGALIVVAAWAIWMFWAPVFLWAVARTWGCVQ